MLGWQIFVHSVRMVFGNLKQVLQITFGPALIATALIVALFMVSGVPLEAFEAETGELPPGTSPGSILLLVFGLIAVIFVTMFWIAVSWHRFILLEEYPNGILPTFRSDRILAYFGRAILLVLLMAIAWLPGGVVLGTFVQSSPVLGILLLVAYLLFLAVCLYRLSIILPAAAIGSPITLGEAWKNTAGTAGAILVLLIVAFLFQFAVQLVFTLLAFIPVLGILLTVFFGTLILPMINVSIFTTMYGVFIEKRELS
ncbi:MULTISPECIES: hypothetical protein [unclassified Ruegeria]|uniref:hypothetical protein n=1 Tax=unclassified Ruegeria TaxID=2625375 RepID=UPI0014899FC8|nr:MULTISPECIES: hypothetical protein [unclassified Ruegeria]NOD76089.1 hypothetical protein [Ruegeria sp. HKCCD4332]NOD90048.1 hypothetical protein [Ruegeria sp. HKCCD4318]NOD93964.1 hypothetical protein [Ruegeria sp. HKCCD4884]NOE15121.1 hypothetical protein [Ruegeria sp. HKCCD4318-2]NOG10668.1 hypothetical protein [Ruegeria sp. HKCCD4315]